MVGVTVEQSTASYDPEFPPGSVMAAVERLAKLIRFDEQTVSCGTLSGLASFVEHEDLQRKGPVR